MAVSVVSAVNMNESDISAVMENILLEFAVRRIDFALPHWVQALPPDDEVVKEIVSAVRDMGARVDKMKDYTVTDEFFADKEFWKLPASVELDAGKGVVNVAVEPKEGV